ncbi:hypothetical protein V8J82_12135 [Gymnodinialimonas sp. 2305UL16-5]
MTLFIGSLLTSQAAQAAPLHFFFTSTIERAEWRPTNDCETSYLAGNPRCIDPVIQAAGETGTGHIIYDTETNSVMSCDLGLGGGFHVWCPTADELRHDQLYQIRTASFAARSEPLRMPSALNFEWNTQISQNIQFSLSSDGGFYRFEDDDYPFYAISRVSFSDVQLAPVPLGGSGIMMAGVVLGAGLVARRSRRPASVA